MQIKTPLNIRSGYPPDHAYANDNVSYPIELCVRDKGQYWVRVILCAAHMMGTYILFIVLIF